MTSIELTIWSAGFFDGEGWISVSSDGDRGQVGVGQKDRRPLEMLLDLYGVGGVAKPKANGVSQWTVHGRKAATVLEAMVPYLVVKRERALSYIEWAQADYWGRYHIATAMRTSPVVLL